MGLIYSFDKMLKGEKGSESYKRSRNWHYFRSLYKRQKWNTLRIKVVKIRINNIYHISK